MAWYAVSCIAEKESVGGCLLARAQVMLHMTRLTMLRQHAQKYPASFHDCRGQSAVEQSSLMRKQRAISVPRLHKSASTRSVKTVKQSYERTLPSLLKLLLEHY